MCNKPLLFNIVFAVAIIVVLQRFTEDPLIVSYLVFLDEAPKGEDSRPREEGTLDAFGERSRGCCMLTVQGWCRYRHMGLPG